MRIKEILVKSCLLGGYVLLINNAYCQNRFSEQKNFENGIGIREGQKDLFTIAPINKNTNASDFGGYPAGSFIYFCSSERISGATYNYDDATGGAMYNLICTSGTETKWDNVVVSDQKKRLHIGPMCSIPGSKEVFVTVDNIETQNGNGKRMLQLYKGSLAEDGKLLNLEKLPFNGDYFSTGHPTLSADGKILYFASDRPGGSGGVDLYKVSVLGNNTFGPVTNLGSSVNTSGNEFFPWINEKNQLFFASNGHGGFGGLDLFVTYLCKSGWNHLTNLGRSINSSNDDFAFIMESEGKTGYFSSDRKANKSGDNIYAFTLNGNLDLVYHLSGVINDKMSNSPISGVKVQLISIEGLVIDEILTDVEGKYNFALEPDHSYTINLIKEHYFRKQEDFSTFGIEMSEHNVKDFVIEKDPGLALYALISDRQSTNALSGVNVRLIDNMTGNEIGTFITNSNGDFTYPISDKHIGDRISYNLELTKEGYIKSIHTFNSQINDEGTIKLHEKIDIAMVKVEKGSDLGKLIDIKPIYFDYGKSVIRPDAAIELDKIVKIMNENPTIEIELGSHTDARGSAAANIKLSGKRAKASTDYIKKRINNPTRITGKGFGESKPLNNCTDGVKCSEDQYSINRRTEFVIVKM